jgi:Skp family chaperone for outer membrane proteins
MRLSTIVLTAAALALISSPAWGQARPAQPAPPTPSKGKIAFINTALFQDQIAEFRAKLEALNRQFEPRIKEIQTKQDRINALETTINTQKNVLGPAKVAELTEQLERDKRDYQRKAEDLEADGTKARDQALVPIREKLSKFVADYTAKRGIVILIDLSNAIESNLVIWYDPRADISQDFIAEYNKAHPFPPPAKP